MKQFVGYLIKKAMGKGKVAPTIKSVKPTKDISGSVKRVYRDESSKRIDAVTKTKTKMESGRKMMREAQKEKKNLVDTGRAFQFKHSKDIHSVRPGENPKQKFKGLIKERNKASEKVFKTGKQLEAEKRNKASKKMIRENKMGGGMMGRRFGMKKGSKFPDLTGDGKVTFADILKGRGVINGKKKKNGSIYLAKKK
jgi:hypothetical protein